MTTAFLLLVFVVVTTACGVSEQAPVQTANEVAEQSAHESDSDGGAVLTGPVRISMMGDLGSLSRSELEGIVISTIDSMLTGADVAANVRVLELNREARGSQLVLHARIEVLLSADADVQARAIDQLSALAPTPDAFVPDTAGQNARRYVAATRDDADDKHAASESAE